LIVLGILCHAIVNTGVNLPRALAARRPHGDLGITPQVIEPKDLWVAAGMLACGVVAAFLIERRFRARPGWEPVVEPSETPP
jgi:hypothetical protein